MQTIQLLSVLTWLLSYLQLAPLTSVHHHHYRDKPSPHIQKQTTSKNGSLRTFTCYSTWTSEITRVQTRFITPVNEDIYTSTVSVSVMCDMWTQSTDLAGPPHPVKQKEGVMMKWCLMSSDVSWHIRDKLWPMPKHGSIILYVHGNQKAR